MKIENIYIAHLKPLETGIEILCQALSVISSAIGVVGLLSSSHELEAIGIASVLGSNNPSRSILANDLSQNPFRVSICIFCFFGFDWFFLFFF